MLLLCCLQGIAQTQSRQITGTITNRETGEKLVGASIVIKGTKQGTTTNAAGTFTLNMVPGDQVLVISSQGYQEQEIAVQRRVSIDVALSSAAQTISEVVVVGYGTQKKRNVTGAVASYNADDIVSRPVARVDQALVGQIAGVEVKQTTGIPGKAFSINVRGTGSISAGNEPLYVIDGFPLTQAAQNTAGGFTNGNPMDNINPNDIESVQVLKDAAAAAIYGSRAANGVVLITTKRGRTGKPLVNVNAYSGFAQASRKLDVLSGQEWVDRATEIINAQWVASGAGRTAAQTTDQRRQILGLAAGTYNTNYMLDDRWAMPGHPGLYYIDWQDEVLRKGLVQNYQLSASGGNEFVKYYVSGNYGKQEGIVPGSDYTNYAFRSNVEVNASKRLKFGLNIAPAYSVTNDPSVEGKSSIWRMALSFTPVQQSPAGSVNVGNNAQYPWANPDNDPLYRFKNNIGITKRFRTLASFFAEYQLMSGLSLKTTVNLDNTDANTKSYTPFGGTGTVITRTNTPGVITSGSFTSYKLMTFVNENTVNYTKTFNDVHNLTALAGYSFNADKLQTQNFASNGGFNNSVITTLNAAAAITGNTLETQNNLLSYFGRIQYDYENKYLLSTSLRRDGSSRFGSNTKWGLFPSLSLGWRVSDEKFMKAVGFLSDLKLRGSYGESGNYNIGDYSSIPTLATYNYSFNGAAAVGQAPNNIVNSNLTWEKSKTLDVGLDAGIIRNRVNFSFDYYVKNNTDLLLNVPIPGQSGFTSVLSNAGQVRNKGWELEINSRNATGALQWNTSLNLTHNTNKIIALAGGQTQILIPSRYDIPNSVLKVGYALNSISVIRQIGILSQADIDKKVPMFNTESAGDPKYLDANGDGVITADDRVIVGHPTPDYIWGITNSFRYKGFDLSFLVQGQNGGSIYSLLGRAIGRTGLSSTENELGINRDRWRSASMPGNGTTPKAFSTFGSIKNTDWLYSSDYWRVRNITLGYDLGKLVKNKFMQSGRIYATLENFFGKDKYYGGLNSEAANEDLSGSGLYPDAGDYGGLPLPKSFILGLNINF